MGGVEHGQFCTAQGVLKHLSDIGSATWSLVIAGQTFSLLFYQLHSPRWVGWAVLGFTNALLIMLIFLGPAVYKTKTNGDFFGISGYWCWITPEYDQAQFTLDYMILIISASLSFILYALVFLRLRGNVVVTGWHVRFRMLEKDESGWRGRAHADSRALSIARQMILYPVAYTILFLPIAVLRMCEWTGHPVSFAVTIFCDSIFLLGGVVNVVLFCTIRKVIPIREVTTALFTGKVFQTQEKSPTDSTWFIGSMETGEKRFTIDLSPPASNDIFVLRQPKFDIITPPPAVLPDEGAIPTTAQTAHLNATTGRWVMVRANSPEISIAGTRTIPRGSLPRESSIYSKDGGGYDRSSSFSHQSSIRRLPPIPRGPQSTALPPVIETQRTLPPSSLPVTSHSREYSVSRSAPSHTHSRSFDSVASVSWMSDSTLLGPAGGDGLKGDDSSDQS